MRNAVRPICYVFVTALLLAAAAACNKTQNQASANPANGDPTDGNLAPVSQPDGQTQPVDTATAPQGYPPAPGSSYYNEADGDRNYYSPAAGDGYSYEQSVGASEPPPPLPDYSQPPCPGDDYIWTPGYWGYTDAGYYWVPGAWVLAPWVGALWTPPWWGFDAGVYIWHAGYWGPHIGFYGGIDYGFGYTGRGYYGAYWNGGRVFYNRTVTNVDSAVVHNTYNYAVASNRGNRVSYNGGRGGMNARPTAQELAVARDPRTPAVTAQAQHAREAAANRAQFAGRGHPQPAALAATRPLSTGYRTPHERPPASAMRTVEQPPAATRPQSRPDGPPGDRAARQQSPERSSAPEQFQHPATRSAPEAARSNPGAGPVAPENRPSPAVARATQARPQFEHAPAPHNAPQARPQSERALPTRPVAQARPRPERAPAPHPMPQPRAESLPAAPPRPEPQARPEPPRPAAPPRSAPEEKRK